jgi:hypothetical protein
VWDTGLVGPLDPRPPLCHVSLSVGGTSKLGNRETRPAWGHIGYAEQYPATLPGFPRFVVRVCRVCTLNLGRIEGRGCPGEGAGIAFQEAFLPGRQHKRGEG